MFDIIPTKTFMDSVHGYVNIPKCFVDNIIDTELFQRLRNIDQTGMRVLYPDAKHDRFGHSLGVFHLGSKAVDALLYNFSDNIYWKISSDSSRVLFWAKNKMLFLLACLLHDIGHAPFSHSLELSVLKNSSCKDKRFPDIFIEKFNSIERNDEKISNTGHAAPHELLGAMLVLDKLRDNISKVYDDLIELGYPREKSENVLYAEHYQDGCVIDKSELDQDICFIARMITGLKYQGYEPEKQIRNCFIELLNGGNFDVDKLDYIVRDTQMSGISNINIDIERLLKSICIALKTRFVDENLVELDCSNKTIHTLSNYVDSEHTLDIDGNFNGTLIVGEDAEVVIYGGSTFVSLASDEDDEIKYTGDCAKFVLGTKIYQDSEVISTQKKGFLELPDKRNNGAFKINIQDAEVAQNSEFGFRVYGDGKISIKVNGYCKIHVKGKCKTESTLTLFENTKLSGKIHQIVFMGNMISNRVPTSKQYNTFSVGFMKQALNILANVLEARDYLYLWVYAHHKVIYYANFLIPVLANEFLGTQRYDANGGFPIWNLNYDNISFLDDAYIWTVIKYLKSNSSETICELCKEILSRNYRMSLFKSLAEFELLFEEFSNMQRTDFRRHLTDAIDKGKPFVENEAGDVNAGFLGTELIEQIKKCGDIDEITSIVYVDANYKPKSINTHETYILLQGEAVSVNKIPLLAKRSAFDDGDTVQYFYLYYCSSKTNHDEKVQENQRVKEAIKKYFKTWIEKTL